MSGLGDMQGSCWRDLLDVLRSGPLTEEQEREIVAQGPEVAVFAILELSKSLAEQQATTAAESHWTPSTPSGTQPAYRTLCDNLYETPAS